MLRSIVCLLAVAVVISAYDFQDAAFNEFLFEDLRDLTTIEGVGIARQRRDTEVPKEKECGRRGEWKKDMQCCTGDKFNHEQMETYKEIQKQCHSEARGNNADDIVDPFDCDKMAQVKQQIVCVSDCVSKKFGVIDESGALNREAILKEVQIKIGDTKWKLDAAEAFVDKCIAETKSKAPGDATTATAAGGKSCNRQSLDFHHCIWREFLNGCPADLRVDSPKCNKIRERLDKGDTSFLNKRLLHHFHHSQKAEE